MMDWENFPSVYDPLARLAAYQKARDEERIRVEAALAKKPEERTDLDWRWIAYSKWGTAAKC
jgi:hypothetical protein